MKGNGFAKLISAILTIVLMGVLAPKAYALYNGEPFESENFYTYGGRKDGTFSLTYRGRGWFLGGHRCDWNDYVFRININRSFTGSDWKMYSGTFRYQRTPSGRVIFGNNLDSPNTPHVCVGATEFDQSKYPNTYWTTSGVQSYVYTWRQLIDEVPMNGKALSILPLMNHHVLIWLRCPG